MGENTDYDLRLDFIFHVDYLEQSAIVKNCKRKLIILHNHLSPYIELKKQLYDGKAVFHLGKIIVMMNR